MKSLNYAVHGGGFPIVLLHGFCEDFSVWNKVVAEIAAEYMVLLIDLPGFGGSGLADEETASVEDMAAAVREILQEEEISTCCMIGHSMGGYVTLAFAEKYPEMLSGFGLFQSTAYADTEEKKADRIKQEEFIHKNGVEPYVKTLIPTLYSKNYHYKELVEESLDMAKKCSALGVTNALTAMRQRPERLYVLQNAKVPVLLIAGADDTVVPAEKLSYQASLLQSCQFEVLEKSGHMGMMEQPLESAAAIERFMKLIENGN